MISLNEVSFGYNRRKLLFNNLSMQLLSGHIYGLLAKNGEGKSSLLRNMAGLLFPVSGSIHVNGFEPGKREAAFLQDLFFLSEEIYLPSTTPQKFSDCYGCFYPDFSNRQFLTNLHAFDISLEKKLNEMSYGQQKKVLIAFALATNTKVLLMDEPTNGLDIPSKSQFRKLMTAAYDDDRIILISTHQVRDLHQVIDSVVILHEGEILLRNSLEEIAQRLSFIHSSGIPENEQILYSQPSLGGYNVVIENNLGDESPVDLEQLFNAATHNPGKIKKLFGEAVCKSM